MKFFSQNKNAVLLIGFLGFLLYSNTLTHGFVLDDKIVITENQFTKQGVSGIRDIFTHDSMTGFFGKDKKLVAGGRYRPLSMAIHAIEWELYGESPSVYHFINVVCYAFTGILLFFVLLQFFPNNQKSIFGLAFIATAIFVAHPLHTEVVANVKSRDELLSILLALVSFGLVLKWLKSQKAGLLIVSALIFLFSLLSKESSVVFVGIVPLAIYTLMPKKTIKEVVVATTPFFAMTLVYLAIRFMVIDSPNTEIAKELMNNPFLNASSSEQYATIFLTLIYYLKLSFFPHPLTHDYYPTQIPIVGWDDSLVLLSVFLNLALFGFGIVGLLKRNIWGFVIFTYFGGLLLYSNLFFPIGTFMNERFLYVPTIAISVFLAWSLMKIKATNISLGVVAVLLLLYSFKTIDRNFAWETDETLALTDIEVSSESAKCNMAAGLAKIDLSKEERLEAKKKILLLDGVKYLQRSLEIYPSYFPPMILSGNAYSMLKDYKTAYSFYENCLKMNPGDNNTLQNLEYVAQEATADGQFEIAKDAMILYLKFREGDAGINEKLGELYGKNLQRPDLGLPFLLRANELNPNDDGVVQKIGVAYAISGNNNEAINWFKKGVELDSMNARLYLNLGVAYQFQGELIKSQGYIDKAFELEPSLRNGQGE
jgi:tetratricopeptide (TPR) repeat protein|tara:strand:+ start:719 stop:2674 length:1956 start_codon:yes stop_codon:yes gene_type:complete